MAHIDRKNMELVRIDDDHERMATYIRRKNGLMRRAMELSVLCDCDIAMFLFAPDDRLAQYTSSDMEGLLDRYSRTCQQPHETRTNQDLIRMLPPHLAADVMALHPQRKRRGRPVIVHLEGEGDVSSVSDDSALQHRQMDILKPLGLAPEDVKLPLSPRSEDAYARINEEFDMLYSQLQDPGEQPGHNQLERSPTSNDSLAGGPGGKGKRGGRTAPIKKRGAVKPKKKEPAAAVKKGPKGNTKAAVPTSSPTAPQEVVAEGGMPAGEGQREAPAASSAGHVAAAAAWTDPSEAAAAVGSSLPASAAAHPGAEQRSGASAAPQQPCGPHLSAAPQTEVTGPSASAAAPPPSTTQAGSGLHQQQALMHGVNMDIRGMHGATPTLAQGSGVNRADARLDAAGVTFAPRQLTSYTTPNFFTGEAASALRDANQSRPSSASIPTPGAAPAQSPLPIQVPSSHAAPQTHTEQQSLPSQSHAALPSNGENNGEPPAKRRATRKQQPTQKAIDAGLAPALAGQQAHGPERGDGGPMQEGAQQLLAPHASVQPGASLSTAPRTQHLQAGMPVQ